MLKIKFEAETGNDSFTPINIASALIDVMTGGDCMTIDEKTYMAGIQNVAEIAEHLGVFVRNEARRRENNI